MKVRHVYTRVSAATQKSDGTSLSTQRELGIAKVKETVLARFFTLTVS